MKSNGLLFIKDNWRNYNTHRRTFVSIIKKCFSVLFPLQPCTQCGKQFPNLTKLQRHAANHAEGPETRKFKCSRCGKAFKFKHHLKVSILHSPVLLSSHLDMQYVKSHGTQFSKLSFFIPSRSTKESTLEKNPSNANTAGKDSPIRDPILLTPPARSVFRLGDGQTEPQDSPQQAPAPTQLEALGTTSTKGSRAPPGLPCLLIERVRRRCLCHLRSPPFLLT